MPSSSSSDQDWQPQALRLTVFGTGYLGITHAACMASLGFEVLGVDTDAAKISNLTAGRVPIYEPGLPELLRAQLKAGRLRFSTSYEKAAAFGDVHFICTGTPQLPGGEGADLSQVRACVTALAPLARATSLLVGKSTVPVGTARALSRELADAGHQVEIAWNPEFLREGTAVTDTLAPDRIVVGVTSQRAEDLLRRVYSPIPATRFFATTLETAELAKVAANAFLATKVSFINAMAEVCEASGANVRGLSEILGADPRIGESFLRAGLGFGGGCLPKDIRAFMARSAELGVDSAAGLLREVEKINLRRRSRTADLALELAGGDLAEVSVCVLGAAFKPGSDDVRESPALDVAQILHGLGAHVTVYDPVAMANAARACPELAYADTLAEAATDASVVLLATEWAEFATLRPSDLAGVVKHKNIIDARNALSPELWRIAGWNYRALGVGAEASAPV
ncbi:MAG TPA: UDP-glucose/GDP-mannose dehydrogenase family protein [Streptosporangiaceae bacterium]|nr:UDP-glucose/GDP-mannose dehydrogenase family protein [Streptosporangiaceae bacterium]